MVTVLTVVWGLRLAVHIGRRGRGHGEDPRYAKMLAKAPGHPQLYALRKVYLLQGALVWLVSLPVQAAHYLTGPMVWWAWAGAVLWAVGLAFEAIGDHQLARFKADPANQGRSWTGGSGPGPATRTTSVTSSSGGGCSSSSARRPPPLPRPSSPRW